MTTEFPGRFMRLFGGPMWSGQPIENRQDPRKVFSIIIIDFAFYRMIFLTASLHCFTLKPFLYNLLFLLSSVSWHFCATAELPFHRNLFFDTSIF